MLTLLNNETRNAIAGFPKTEVGNSSITVESRISSKEINGDKLDINAEYYKSDSSCGSYRYNYKCESHIDTDPKIKLSLDFLLNKKLYTEINERYLEDNISIGGNNSNINIDQIYFSDSQNDCREWFSYDPIGLKNLSLDVHRMAVLQNTGVTISRSEAEYQLYDKCKLKDDYGKYSEKFEFELGIDEVEQLLKSKNIWIKILDDTYTLSPQAVMDLKMFYREAKQAVKKPYKTYAPETNSTLAN